MGVCQWRGGGGTAAPSASPGQASDLRFRAPQNNKAAWVSKPVLPILFFLYIANETALTFRKLSFLLIQTCRKISEIYYLLSLVQALSGSSELSIFYATFEILET